VRTAQVFTVSTVLGSAEGERWQAGPRFSPLTTFLLFDSGSHVKPQAMSKRKAFSFNDAYEQIPTVDFAGQGSYELLRRFFRQIDAPKCKHATRHYLDLAAAVGPALVGN